MTTLTGEQPITPTERAIWCSAFGAYIAQREQLHTAAEGRERAAARTAWAAVRAFRECPTVASDGQPLASLEMLKELREP